jgi:hypothetical protein
MSEDLFDWKVSVLFGWRKYDLLADDQESDVENLKGANPSQAITTEYRFSLGLEIRF